MTGHRQQVTTIEVYEVEIIVASWRWRVAGVAADDNRASRGIRGSGTAEEFRRRCIMNSEAETMARQAIWRGRSRRGHSRRGARG